MGVSLVVCSVIELDHLLHIFCSKFKEFFLVLGYDFFVSNRLISIEIAGFDMNSHPQTILFSICPESISVSTSRRDQNTLLDWIFLDDLILVWCLNTQTVITESLTFDQGKHINVVSVVVLQVFVVPNISGFNFGLRMVTDFTNVEEIIALLQRFLVALPFFGRVPNLLGTYLDLPSIKSEFLLVRFNIDFQEIVIGSPDKNWGHTTLFIYFRVEDPLQSLTVV